MKFRTSFLIFLLAFTSVSVVKATDYAEECREAVDFLFEDVIPKFVAKNALLQAAWDMFLCLQDFELVSDMKAVCNIFGPYIPSKTEAAVYGNYFIQQQAFSICDICKKFPTYFDSFSEKNMELALNWVSKGIKDPKLAQALRQHGPGIMSQAIQAAFPGNLCVFLNSYCKKVEDGQPTPIADVIKEGIRNGTQCVECNLCTNAVLYLQRDVVPHQRLPMCIINEVEEKFCDLLKGKVIPGLGDLSDACKEGIEYSTGNIISALKTFTHPNLLCGSFLKWCDTDHSDNMLECVCDYVKLPSSFDWILPCGWQRGTQ